MPGREVVYLDTASLCTVDGAPFRGVYLFAPLSFPRRTRGRGPGASYVGCRRGDDDCDDDDDGGDDGDGG